MKNILEEIFEYKRVELERTKRNFSLEDLKKKIADSPRKPLDVISALKPRDEGKNIIAEIKYATPFKGNLIDANAVKIAKTYEDNGAVAISVLTEQHYFKGSLKYLSDIRKEVKIPLLRKDFIFDEYQIYEALAFGADFFLLIATELNESLLRDLVQLGDELNLKALVEVHDEADLKKALAVKAEIIGVNNRDLIDGETHLDISRNLLKADFGKDRIILSESGIRKHSEIEELSSLGAHAFLIGETLMLAKDIPAKLRELRGMGNG